MQGSIQSNSPRTKAISAFAYRQDVEKAVVIAYAEAVASVQSVYDKHECYAYGNAEGCIITEEHPEGICAECTAESVNLAQITEIPAIATAGAPSPMSHALKIVGTYVYQHFINTASAMAQITRLRSRLYISPGIP